MLETLKLQHKSGMERGLCRPVRRFPVSLPLHNCINMSPISSILFGSSRANGRLDFCILSRQRLSDVPFVFIRWLTSFCPNMDRVHCIAVDFPVHIQSYTSSRNTQIYKYGHPQMATANDQTQCIPVSVSPNKKGMRQEPFSSNTVS